MNVRSFWRAINFPFSQFPLQFRKLAGSQQFAERARSRSLYPTLMWILSSSSCDSDICYHGSLSSGHIVNCDLALLMEIRSKVATYVKIVM